MICAFLLQVPLTPGRDLGSPTGSATTAPAVEPAAAPLTPVADSPPLPGPSGTEGSAPGGPCMSALVRSSSTSNKSRVVYSWDILRPGCSPISPAPSPAPDVPELGGSTQLLPTGPPFPSPSVSPLVSGIPETLLLEQSLQELPTASSPLPSPAPVAASPSPSRRPRSLPVTPRWSGQPRGKDLAALRRDLADTDPSLPGSDPEDRSPVAVGGLVQGDPEAGTSRPTQPTVATPSPTAARSRSRSPLRRVSSPSPEASGEVRDDLRVPAVPPMVAAPLLSDADQRTAILLIDGLMTLESLPDVLRWVRFQLVNNLRRPPQ